MLKNDYFGNNKVKMLDNSYNSDFVSNYKSIISSYLSGDNLHDFDPQAISVTDYAKVINSKICNLNQFCKRVFAQRNEIVMPRKFKIYAARKPENFVEGNESIEIQNGPVSIMNFKHLEILGGSKKIRGFVLRDPLTESITWEHINYANAGLTSFLPLEIISSLVKQDVLYKKLTRRQHKGKYIFFGGSSNHAHFIWEFLMRMPLIEQMCTEKNIRLAVTIDSKQLVERWFDLLGYPKDNLYFFSGDEINYFEEISIISCLFANNNGLYSISPESLFEIRRRALRNVEMYSKNRNKVYICRSDANHRKMTNEDDFISYLSKNGFDILTLSDIPLDKQINAIANARVVVSPVGAGSAMAMFAPADAVVIEIASRELFGGYNGIISGLLLNQSFYRVISDIKGENMNDVSLREDFVGDLQALKNTLIHNGVEG